jgi:hypothetical protein
VNLSPGQWIACSAAVIGVLGSLHLAYTFQGKKLKPRDTHLERQMEVVSPELTRHTTMWLAWIGFNASHSFGALFFAFVYAYLGLVHPEFLFDSLFLLATGLAMLLGYAWLGWKYWFRSPLGGVLIALALYCWAVVQAGMAA